MLHYVALVRTNVSEEHIASVIKDTRICELQLLVTANIVPGFPLLVTLMMEAIRSSKTFSYKSHMVPPPRRRHSSW
jgi:hypothetical protein